MIYVPMLKTRREEMDVAESLVNCFSEKIIPLIEILDDEYQVRYKIDPKSKEFIYEQRGKSRRKVKETPLDSDIITLDSINEKLQNKFALIDYFRFSINKYGRDININGAQLAWRMSQDEMLYKSNIRSIKEYPNLCPVMSIKKDFSMGKRELNSFINEIQGYNESIALRITDDFIEEYRNIISGTLRDSDYLLFDICEQNPNSKIMEYEELSEIKTRAQVILLNSPRKMKLKNGAYPIHDLSDLIDCSAREIALNNSFSGYGDYCGLKDALPQKSGYGTGSAIVLFYDYSLNKFYSYVHPDTSKGLLGYKHLIPIIISDLAILDPDRDCPAIKKITTMKGSGNWSTWHNLNATRYIYQVYKNIK